MLKLRSSCTDTVEFLLDGRPVRAERGSCLAAALRMIAPGMTRTTPVSGQPRAPYCMMGVCFECLVEIDGRPNQQACLARVTPGLDVRRQLGARIAPEFSE